MPRVEQTPRPKQGRRLFWLAKGGVGRAGTDIRRMAFIAQSRLHAFAQRADLLLDVSPDVTIGRGVRVRLAPRTRNVLRIGPGSRLGDRTLLELDGGEMQLGDLVDIRRDTILTVSGRLSMEGRNLLQHGTTIHCDDAVTLRRMAVLSERVTIVDSSHYFTTRDDWILDNVRTGPVEIGYNTWIGAKATVGRNVTVGDFAVVAANALVLSDVPSGHLASGVPAKVVRRLELPWKDGDVPTT